MARTAQLAGRRTALGAMATGAVAIALTLLSVLSTSAFGAAKRSCISHSKKVPSARISRGHRPDHVQRCVTRRSHRTRKARKFARHEARTSVGSPPGASGSASPGSVAGGTPPSGGLGGTPPSAPGGLSTVAGDAEVVLSWGASSASRGVAGYRVYRNGGQVGQTQSTGFTDNGLTNGTTYSYYVVAYDTAGALSPPSETVSAAPIGGAGENSQTTWTAAGIPPLSDANAAALVTHKPEQRPGNVEANDYVPTAAELQGFHIAVNQYGQTADQANPLNKYVDGLDGMSNPSTDDLIQWAAHKWGIPEDWLRAQYVLESWWRQSTLGDRASVSNTWYWLYPPLAQIPGTSEVYESMGIAEVRWRPDNSLGIGTEPLRWKSTAFNVDFQAATVRFYYDGYCNWCTSGYSSGQQWDSIGAWYQPSPWNNSGQQSYIDLVQNILSERTWEQPGF
jgi:chitodextrinase